MSSHFGKTDDRLEAAARIIQKAWKQYVHKEVFRYFKQMINLCDQQDPQSILKTVNPREAELLDAAAGVFIRFRLGGTAFPPNIYYKIFTHRPITDVCASSPKNYYTRTGLGKPVGEMQRDPTGWYQRIENNSWRLFYTRLLPVIEPKEIGANKKKDFHYSKLQRQQEVDRWRKRRRIAWLRQMYNLRGLHNQLCVNPNAFLEGVDTTEEGTNDELEDKELEELLTWSSNLSFEEYMEDWKCLACSHISEANKCASL